MGAEVVGTFCRVCVAACGVLVTVEDERVVEVRGDPDHPISRGYLCPKGRAIGDLHHADDRLQGCLVRVDGQLAPTDWAACVDDAGAALAGVAERSGTDAIGFFLGGGAYNDAAAYWASRRLQGLLGTTHRYSDMSVDSASKFLVPTLMAGTTALLPQADPDARLVVFIGTNPVVSHGHTSMYPNPVERIRETRAAGEVWVLDPRTTEAARLADRHLAVRPGTDHAVLAYAVRCLLADGTDHADLAPRADGIDELTAAVAPFDRVRVAAMTGLTPDELDAFVDAVRRAGRLAIVTGTGASMARAGNVTEWLAWALLLVTDSFDRPGGVWCNPGFFARLDRRGSLPSAGGTSPGPPSRPEISRLMGEWPAALIAEEILAGRLRALVVLSGNLVTALPNTPRLVEALRRLEALIVFEIVHTETVELATHVIDCPDQLERSDIPSLDLFGARVFSHHTPAVVPLTAGRQPMWRSLAALGVRLGIDDLLGGGLDAATASNDEVLRRVTRDGVDSLIGAPGPVVADGPLFGWVDERLPTGRWQLAPRPLVEQLAGLEDPSSLVLTPRRQLRRMNHRRYRAGEAPEALLHPDDAAIVGVGDGDTIELSSSTGAIRAVARVTTATTRGAVSVPHGWAGTNVNQLIADDDLDPLTGMPRLSGMPVTVRFANPQ